MQRFKNVLVIHNNNVGDEQTLRRATSLAMQNDARLTVAEVLEDPERLVAGAGRDAGMRKRLVEQRLLSLERLVTSIRQEGIATRTRVLTGDPFLQITREVVRENHDLAMMTAEGSGGLKEMLFGTTSMQLMRKCPCPVWVTKGKPGRYSGILAAVDPTSGGDVKDGIDLTILQLASSLARRERSVLHVVHAWELVGTDLDTSRSEISARMLDELVLRNEESYRRRVEALLEACDVDGLAVKVHLPQGRPQTVVPALAREHAIELIVMGTVCRTGVPGLIVGNTAETVLQQVDCAVMTVKPPGFVTPVVDENDLPVRPLREAV